MIIYFVENWKRQSIKVEELKDLGLGYAFDKRMEYTNLTSVGPSGSNGILVGRSTPKYLPESQLWEKHESIENVWIGYPKGEIETKDLIRDKWKSSNSNQPLIVPSGIHVTDKGSWDIPIAREWTAGESKSIYRSTLPHRLRWDGEADDFVFGEVIEKFGFLEEIGKVIIDYYCDDDFELPSHPINLCSQIIEKVYYLSPQEFATLEIVTTDVSEAWSILRIVADIATLQSLREKKSLTKTQGS